jgi:hypothetical protein
MSPKLELREWNAMKRELNIEGKNYVRDVMEGKMVSNPCYLARKGRRGEDSTVRHRLRRGRTSPTLRDPALFNSIHQTK